jgi:hypothetical protein
MPSFEQAQTLPESFFDLVSTPFSMLFLGWGREEEDARLWRGRWNENPEFIDHLSFTGNSKLG